MTLYDDYRDKQAEHSWEDSEGRVAAKIAEPLIPKAGPGRNYYTSKQFRAIAVYLLEREVATPAIQRGSFFMGQIEFVRTPHLREDRKVSATSLAAITGSPERTLARLLLAVGRPREIGANGEKLYDLDELRETLGGSPKNALGDEGNNLGPAGGHAPQRGCKAG